MESFESWCLPNYPVHLFLAAVEEEMTGNARTWAGCEGWVFGSHLPHSFLEYWMHSLQQTVELARQEMGCVARSLLGECFQ
jgi:hypothetical protein